MAEFVADTTANLIVDDIKSTLKAATVIDDKPVFESVGVFDDLESFRRKCDGLNGITAGIIPTPAEQSRGQDNSEEFAARMQIRIAVSVPQLTSPGQDENVASQRIAELVTIVRQALLTDKTRGGHCDLVNVGGRMIAGTEVTGDARMDNRRPNQAFNIFTVPIQCGWPV